MKLVLLVMAAIGEMTHSCKRRSSPPPSQKGEINLLPLLPMEYYVDLYEKNKKMFSYPTPLEQQVSAKNAFLQQSCYRCGTVIGQNFHPIIGGGDAPEKGFPWQAFVSSGINGCGGVLIASSWVLTAAHCLMGDDTTVLLGLYDVGNVTKHVQERRAAKQIPHPDFGRGMNDIALIKLRSPVTFNEYVRPACVPYTDSDFSASTTCFVTGWGLLSYETMKTPRRLQELKVRILNQDSCKERWLKNGRPLDNSHLCTHQETSNRDAGICLGDSGGPLSCLKGDSFYVVGIGILVEEYCHKTVLPDLFMRISEFRRWVERTLLANS